MLRAGSPITIWRLGSLYPDIAASTGGEVWDVKLIAGISNFCQRRILPADQLLHRTEWRDRRLMALRAHLSEREAQEAAAVGGGQDKRKPERVHMGGQLG